MVSQYESMGGVDLADMLIAIYRTKIKTKRWYLKVLFHCLDIAKVNASLLYCLHCVLKKVPKKQQQPVLDLSPESLIKHGKSGMTKKVGRPSLEQAEVRAKAEKGGRKPDTPLPVKAPAIIGQSTGMERTVADIARLLSAGCIVIGVVCVCALAIQGTAFKTFTSLNERHKH